MGCRMGAKIVITLLVTLVLCTGQGRAKTFSVSIKGKPSNIARKENDVRLLCETGVPSSIQITRLRDGHILKTTQGEEQSLEHLIQSVTCEDMGTYLCVFDNENQTADIVVSDCGPQPCHVDDVNRTIYVEVNQPVQFSLCVLAYPGIAEFVELNNNNNNNNTVRKKSSSNWTWDYHELNTTSSLFVGELTFTRDQMVEDEYGLLKIRLFSSAGKNYYLDYDLWLLPPGPPECPENVTAIDEGLNHMELSWRPGFDGGFKQSFHVYFSKDKVTWYRYDVINGQSTANITGLEEDTSYYFRVVSSNAVRMLVDETVCDNTIWHKTDGKGENSTHETSHITAIICVLSIVVAVMLTFILYQRRVKKRSETTQGDGEIQQNHESQDVKLSDNSSMDPGYYISEEGLTYISVSHITDKKTQKKARERDKRNEEKIEYASLDFIKSGQVQLQEDAQRTARKKQRADRE